MKFSVVITVIGGKEYRTAIESNTIAEAEAVLQKHSSWYEFPVGAALVKVNPATVVSLEFHPIDTQYNERIEAFMPVTTEPEEPSTLPNRTMVNLVAGDTSVRA